MILLSLAIWTFTCTFQQYVRGFYETLGDRGMKQLTKDATHSKGQILDVVIVRNNNCVVPVLPTVYDPCLCDTHPQPCGDHLAIKYEVNARKAAGVRKKTNFSQIASYMCIFDFVKDMTFLCDILALMNLFGQWWKHTTLECVGLSISTLSCSRKP